MVDVENKYKSNQRNEFDSGMKPGWLASPAVSVHDYAKVTVTLHMKISTLVGPAVTKIVVLAGAGFNSSTVDERQLLFEKEITTTVDGGDNDKKWMLVEMPVDVTDIGSIVVGCLAPAEAAGG